MSPTPTEFTYRLLTQACVRQMGRGSTIDSKQDMEDYRQDPFLTPNPKDAYCWLPNIMSTEPEDQDTPGMQISHTPISELTV